MSRLSPIDDQMPEVSMGTEGVPLSCANRRKPHRMRH